MIHYQLRCPSDHAFDGWFKSSAAFEQQAAKGLLSCPHCGDRGVTRALMAPALARRDAAAPATAAMAPPKAVAGPHLPDQVRAVLQRLRTEIEKHCDYVGADFAAEARRIHAGESAVRPIYGEASREQAEQLAEEGIEVARIPWVPRADG
ncbi:DUF1178 family protein [Acidibrevibacterium fodinaquatile]|jgi:hypothetical protein|uniref:DUF1178 family protein n=1 Tax=Acidibrevibacterium fodinaquatile TaxID=1969806 RepID=UPI000E0CF178|nr:DUF1178 family protein [Acidibrevibacterium fodinaquatile]